MSRHLHVIVFAVLLVESACSSSHGPTRSANGATGSTSAGTSLSGTSTGTPGAVGSASAGAVTGGVTGSSSAGTGAAASTGTTSGAAPSTVITVDASDIGNAILSTQLGSNLDVFAGASTQLPDAGVEYTAPLLTGLGIQTVRWPGGADADYYHWETNTACAGGSAQPNNDFESFMLQTVRPANLQVVMTVNYGSNQTCDGGGDPAEAAAWVARARDAGYNVHYWTVGNEDYHAKPPDGGEFDLHARPHDPTTYAAAVGRLRWL